MRRISATQEQFKLDGTFTISRGSRTVADVICVSVSEGDFTGRGECVPYARYGESTDSVLAQIDSISDALSHGLDRAALQTELPAGAARNAIDCALWDLEAKSASQRVHERIASPPPKPLVSAYTIGIDSPEAMHEKAVQHAARPLLKIKLGSSSDLTRLESVRAGAPNAELIVDANEAWTVDDYRQLLPSLQTLGVTLIEQPFHADADEALRELARPIRVCADESCHDRASLSAMQGKYDVANIKLDKTGGLTEALALRDAATAEGFGIMVGCMVGTSLAMAPAQLVAQGAEVVDLDGPLLLAEDRSPAIVFNGSTMSPADHTLWG